MAANNQILSAQPLPTFHPFPGRHQREEKLQGNKHLTLCFIRPLPGMLQLSAQAHLLPHLPRTTGLHQEPSHGEGG